MAEATKRAAIYTRVSKVTDTNEESTTRQAQRCRDYAKAQGWDVVKVFEDKGISAFSGATRPAWQALEKAITEDQIDVVLFRSLDRSGRDTGELFRFLNEVCRPHGAALASATEPFDTTTAFGEAIFGLLAVFARLESAIKSERQRPAKAQAKAEGKWLGGGRRPFGYRGHVNGNRKTEWDIDQDEAKVIKDLAARILAGESANAVTVRLNEQGVKTSGGNRWRPAHVKRLLERELPSAVFPPILKADVAEAVRAELKNRERKQGRPSDARTFVLNGLVICDKCGVPMIGSRETRTNRGGKVYEQYRCSVRAGGDNCGGIGAIPLERWFVDALADENERRGRGWIVTKSTPVNDDSVVAELNALGKRESELGDALADGRLSMTVVEKSLAKIKAEREELQEKLRKTAKQQPVSGTMTVNGKEVPVGKVILGAMVGAWFKRTLPQAEAIQLHDGFAQFVKEIRVRPKVDRNEAPADRCTPVWK